MRHSRGSRPKRRALLYKRTMSDTDLRKNIKEMLVKNLMLQTTADEIGDDLPLFGPGGLGLDSIDALELVVSMEKTFGVGVPNSEVAGKALRTVNTIHDYILEKRAAAPTPSNS
jgi:acyl carrier protein